jgi:hypothetical protein
MTVVAAMVATACASPAYSPMPAAAPTAAIPADWLIVSTSGTELQLALPPWLLVSDNIGAIFANEPPRAGAREIPIQLMAIPPNADSQLGPGEDLGAWIERRLGDPRHGVPVVTQISLPAGSAVRYERIDRAGTPTAWHILAVAIRTPSGVAFLLIDGLPDAWPAHAVDIERIPFLLRIPVR